MKVFSDEAVFGNNAKVKIQRLTDSFWCAKHTHEFIEMKYIETGISSEYINDREFKVKKGDLLFINYGKSHSFTAPEGSVFYNILLTPGFISDELTNSENAIDLLSLSCFNEFSNFIEEPIITFSADEIIFIERILSEMFREYMEKKPGYEQLLKSCITILLIHIFRKMDLSNIIGSQNKIPNEILDYLDSNYNEKITINTLAKRCFYNPSYFSRIFSETYGITVTEYITQKRFEKACELLKNTNLSVEEIAVLSGFRNTSAIFSRFKNEMGITPGEYRRNVKKNNI